MDKNNALNEFVESYYGQLSDLVYKNPVMLSPEETYNNRCTEMYN